MAKPIVIIHGVSSERTHYPHCEWIISQEHNSNIHLIRRDSTVDEEWFAKRKREREVRAHIGRPLPHCTYCNCEI